MTAHTRTPRYKKQSALRNSKSEIRTRFLGGVRRSTTNPKSEIRNPKSAFTLLEVLMVVLVIGIAASAIAPVAIESVEGARLRSATRDVVSLNRYARGRAILEGRPVAILYEVEGGRVELVQLPAQELALGPFLDTPPPRVGEEVDLSGDILPITHRVLARGVVITEVRGAERVADTWFAVYFANGMCDPHTVTLRDNRDDTQTIRVNGMTGDITLGNRR